MFDRLQTVALLFLIGSSLVLSTYLWLAPSGEAAPTGVMYSPPVAEIATPALAGLLRPHGIVLYGSDDADVVEDDEVEQGAEEEEQEDQEEQDEREASPWEITLRPGDELYDALWAEGTLLRRIFTGIREDTIPQEVTEAPSAGVRFLFEVELSLLDWLDVFLVRTPGDWPATLVGEFHLLLDGDFAYFQIEGAKGSFDLRVRYGMAEEMNSLIDEIRQLQGEREHGGGWEYRPPESFDGILLKTSVLVPQGNLSPYYVYAESYDAQSIVEAIFFDRSVPRRIEERDGSVIYTDERRGVRIYPRTGWEYTSPLGGGAVEVTSELEALALATKFAHTHGGIASDMRITTLERRWGNEGYRWVIGFSQDVAGVTVTGSANPVSVLVGRHGVEGYRRSLSFAAGPALNALQLITPESALLSLTETLGFSDGRDDGGLALDFLRLVYWSPDEAQEPPVFYPAWYARLSDGRRAVVDGYSGQVRLGW